MAEAPSQRAFSKQPSPYPRFVFHGLRAAQFFSSAVVLSIVSYFTWWLIYDSYAVPWTFIFLITIAALTLLALFATTFLHHIRILRPRTAVWPNAALTAIWCTCLGLLTWNTSQLLGKTCDVENWQNETGVMVCRLYKALESFTIVATVASIAVLVLDVYTISAVNFRGRYANMNTGLNGAGRAVGVADEKKSPQMVAQDLTPAGGENGYSYREPSLEFPEYSHEARNPYKAQRQMEAERFGYEKVGADTGYAGGGA